MHNSLTHTERADENDAAATWMPSAATPATQNDTITAAARLHALAAQLDQLEAVLERHSARESQRGVLAEREAGGHVDGVDGRLALRGADLLDSGQRGDVDGGLRDGGRVQLLLGACTLTNED